VRAAREGEVLMAGQAIVTVVDLSEPGWRVAHSGDGRRSHWAGRSARVRLPGGTLTQGKVFFKAAERISPPSAM